MANEHFCPILAIVDKRQCRCSGCLCAWWVSTIEGGCCALKVLADAADRKGDE